MGILLVRGFAYRGSWWSWFGIFVECQDATMENRPGLRPVFPSIVNTVQSPRCKTGLWYNVLTVSSQSLSYVMLFMFPHLPHLKQILTLTSTTYSTTLYSQIISYIIFNNPLSIFYYISLLWKTPLLLPVQVQENHKMTAKTLNC